MVLPWFELNQIEVDVIGWPPDVVSVMVLPWFELKRQHGLCLDGRYRRFSDGFAVV